MKILFMYLKRNFIAIQQEMYTILHNDYVVPVYFDNRSCQSEILDCQCEVY